MKVLVVAAHPDDEILGLGGTIARHTQGGDSVSVVIVAEGATSRREKNLVNTEILKNCALNAAKILGTEKPQFLGLPDQRLETVEFLDIVKKIEEFMEKVKPDVIYTHHGNDLNLDHRTVHQAVITAFRPIPGTTFNKIYGFETLSSTEWSTTSIGPRFCPNYYVDISQTLDIKTKALESYEVEMRPFPHPRSIEAVKNLGKVRGSAVGVVAAEAFETLLEINR